MNADTMWFIRDKQSPKGFNRLLCDNGTGKYKAFSTEIECAMLVASLPNSDQYEPVVLEVED